MITYDVTLKRGLFSKKIKKVKGHIFTPENKDIMMLILENEERIFVNMSRYKLIYFSDGLFESIKERVKEDSKGTFVMNKS